MDGDEIPEAPPMDLPVPGAPPPAKRAGTTMAAPAMVADHPVAALEQRVTLNWPAVGAPAEVTLINVLTGAETRIPDGQTHADVGIVRRRQTYQLRIQGPGGAPPVVSEPVTVASQGIDLLAGDSEHVDKAYLNGPLATAAWRHISGLLWHGGTLYFSEGADQTIRRVVPGNMVAAFTGVRGGPQLAASDSGAPRRLNLPGPMAVLDGNIYEVDTGSHAINRIGPDGTVDLFAGNPGRPGLPDEKLPPGVIRPRGPVLPTAVHFDHPADIVADPMSGFLYVADQGNDAIRMIRIEGDGRLTVKMIPETVPAPQGLALGPAGELYVSCPNQSMVMVLAPSPRGSWAGSWNAGVLVGADDRKGSADGPKNAPPDEDEWGLPHMESPKDEPKGGFADGPAEHARFNRPLGLACVHRDLLVADSGNNLIRAINLDTRVVRTIAGDALARASGRADGAATEARFEGPSRLAVGDVGQLYVSDQRNQALRMIDAGGMVTTLGGNNGPAAAGAVDGPSGTARFSSPMGLAMARNGLIYVADSGNHVIRRVSPAGVVTTYAGHPGDRGAQDGPSGAARFDIPSQLALDGAGRLYVVEGSTRARLRMIHPDGRVETLRTGSDTPDLIASCPFANKPSLLKFFHRRGGDTTELIEDRDGISRPVMNGLPSPSALAMDPDGNAYTFSPDQPGQKAFLGKFSRRGILWVNETVTIGPRGRFGKEFGMPEVHSMAADSRGNLFLADTANGLVWMVSRDMQNVEVVAGGFPLLTSTLDAKPLHAGLYQPRGIAVTPMGDLVLSAGHALLQITCPGTDHSPWAPPPVQVVRKAPAPGTAEPEPKGPPQMDMAAALAHRRLRPSNHAPGPGAAATPKPAPEGGSDMMSLLRQKFKKRETGRDIPEDDEDEAGRPAGGGAPLPVPPAAGGGAHLPVPHGPVRRFSAPPAAPPGAGRPHGAAHGPGAAPAGTPPAKTAPAPPSAPAPAPAKVAPAPAKAAPAPAKVAPAPAKAAGAPAKAAPAPQTRRSIFDFFRGERR